MANEIWCLWTPKKRFLEGFFDINVGKSFVVNRKSRDSEIWMAQKTLAGVYSVWSPLL